MTQGKYPNVWEIDLSSYRRWISTEEPRYIDGLECSSRLKFSVVMPVHDPGLGILRESLSSILNQIHGNWELCIADDASKDPEVVNELETLALGDDRVNLVRLTENRGIAQASNAALGLASGDYAVLVDHDDRLAPHALATVEHAINSNPRARLLYSDSDHLDANGERCRPFFKPDWDYLRLLSQNYLNHLTVVDLALLRSIGGWREGYQGSQDYDLYLRLVEELTPGEVHHIPHILYHWRIVPDSVARSGIGEAVKMARKAIRDHLDRRGYPARVEPAGKAVIFNHVAWQLPERQLRILDVTHGDLGHRNAAQPSREQEQQLDVSSMRLHAPVSRPVDTKSVRRELESGSYDILCLRVASLTTDTHDWLQQAAATTATNLFGVVGAKCIDSDGRVYGGPLFSQPGATNIVSGATSDHTQHATGPSRGYVANMLLDQSVDEVMSDFLMIGIDALNRIGGLLDSYDSVCQLTRQLCKATAGVGLRNVWLAGLVFRRPARITEEVSTLANPVDYKLASSDAPFIYPNPNFQKLQWITHWTE